MNDNRIPHRVLDLTIECLAHDLVERDSDVGAYRALALASMEHGRWLLRMAAAARVRLREAVSGIDRDEDGHEEDWQTRVRREEFEIGLEWEALCRRLRAKDQAA